jgi:3-oxoacyl-[acyl-carrier protein] reductase
MKEEIPMVETNPTERKDWWSSASAIVTGAGSGIGLGVAKALAAEGAHVTVVDISAENARSGVEEIEKLVGGGSATAVAANVADKHAVQKVVYDAVEHRGGVEILVNNAGVSRPNMLWNITDEQWDEVIATNLSSQFYAIRAATNAWMKEHGGAIVNVSSLAGLRGSIGQINYAAAKAGILGITKAAALDLAKFGVRVNAVAPGLTGTNMTRTIMETPKLRERYEGEIPLGRAGTPDDIGAAVAFLAGPSASWITGKVLAVDGGAYN